MAKCKETLAITNHRVISEDINEHETVYGGRILEILDGTASTSAANWRERRPSPLQSTT